MIQATGSLARCASSTSPIATVSVAEVPRVQHSSMKRPRSASKEKRGSSSPAPPRWLSSSSETTLAAAAVALP